MSPEDVLRALDELEGALETVRAAYTAWLEGDGDDGALDRALLAAESRLGAARDALARADKQ